MTEIMDGEQSIRKPFTYSIKDGVIALSTCNSTLLENIAGADNFLCDAWSTFCWLETVSYTHLDVYKRQPVDSPNNLSIIFFKLYFYYECRI